MYSSSYSRAKFGQEAREPLHKSRGKSCGYYVKIIFFFSSLIQSLIIVSLVLFLIYGQPEKSAEEMRVKELEQGFNRLSENNIQLRKEKGELGAQLEARTAEKAALEKEMVKIKADANATEIKIRSELIVCQNQVTTVRTLLQSRNQAPPIQTPIMITATNQMKTLQSSNSHQQALIELIKANFTQTVQHLSKERDAALSDRDIRHNEAITERRTNTMLREQHVIYTRKCKEDFAHSLDGIQTVTRDFLSRINSLFPHQMTFHLTCNSQQEQMEKIRTSCTNLSRDVENKFQLYLDKVGDKVAEIQELSSRLEVQNNHLSSQLQTCERTRGEAAAETAKQLEQKQKAHDDQVEKLLNEKKRLQEQKELQEQTLALMRNKGLQQMPPPKFDVPKSGGLQGPGLPGRPASWPFKTVR